MRAAARWSVAVVAGGLGLGALLGQAVRPDMTDPPRPSRALAADDDIAAWDEPAFPDSRTGPLAPRGYRPDLDYETEVWALAIPADDLAVLTEPFEPFDPAAPGETRLAAERAADAAAAVVATAKAVGRPPDAPAAEPVETRKSELARGGLY